jgi:hypothetical protein
MTSAMSAPRRIHAAVTLVPLVAALLFTTSAHAESGSCNTVANVTSTVWDKTGPTVKSALNTSGPFGATAAKTLTLLEKGIKIWNKISGSTWAKVGPRRLDFEKWEQGTLIGPTERMFISTLPALNPVTVDINKLDHEGKVKVVVCKVPEKGKAKLVKAVTIEAGAKNGRVASIDIPDAKGHLVTVVLHGKSVAKKLQYKVRVKMDYPTEEPPQKGTTYTGKREEGTKHTGKREQGTTATGKRDQDKTVTGKRTEDSEKKPTAPVRKPAPKGPTPPSKAPAPPSKAPTKKTAPR